MPHDTADAPTASDLAEHRSTTAWLHIASARHFLRHNIGLSAIQLRAACAEMAAAADIALETA